MATFKTISTGGADLRRVQTNISEVVDQLSQEIGLQVVSVTKAYQATGSEDVILADPSAGILTVTLPNPGAVTKAITVKRIGASKNAVNLNCANAGTSFDGAGTLSLKNPNDRATVVPSGSNYYVVG